MPSIRKKAVSGCIVGVENIINLVFGSICLQLAACGGAEFTGVRCRGGEQIADYSGSSRAKALPFKT